MHTDINYGIEDAVVKATERNLLHHEKWNKKIMRLLWTFVTILFVFEGLIALLYCMGMTLGADHTNWEYTLRYFLVPCCLVTATTGLSAFLVSRVFHKTPIEFRSRLLIVTMVLIVSEIVALNHGTNVIYVMYVVPIMLSIVYVNQKTLFLGYILSVGLYLVVLGYLRVFVAPADYRHTYMDILTNIGLLTAVYLLARLILGRIRELINTAVSQSIRQVELSRELSLDSLTQLYNHATFYDQLDEYILRFKNEGKAFSLLVMDLDNFKSINDTYGHDAGDTVILSLTAIIRNRVSGRDIAFRYGGEEFTVLTTGNEGALALAESIREDMSRQKLKGIDRSVTISIGVCHYDATFGGRREFFAAADKALYAAKKEGKNRVCLAGQTRNGD